MKSRIIVWFSAGAASAVASKIVADRFKDGELPQKELKIYYIDTGGEHEDNKRFVNDIQDWIEYPVDTIKNTKGYVDHFDVFRKTRFLNGDKGARCTVELKKRVRQEIEDLMEDIQVFGYCYDKREIERAVRFRSNNPEVELWTPLIEEGLSHSDCLGMIDMANIELPVLYKQGFNHNNCLGCVKGGMGYWNKIRQFYPEIYEKMAKIERELGNSVLKEKIKGKHYPLFLDEMSPDRGAYQDEPFEPHQI